MHLLRVNTEHGLKYLTHKIPKMWNKLPKWVKELTSLNTFKNDLKELNSICYITITDSRLLDWSVN